MREYEAAFPDRRIELQQDGDLNGEWDADRLAQAASNLIGNALQHGGSGAPVQVSIDGTDADGVALSVINAGCIPEALLPHVFEPFQGGKRQPGTNQGLGLGLYIVQQIVQVHHGQVTVQSGNDGQTSFHVVVPRRSLRP